jgi:Ca2+-binding RTX toxin-like protein
MSKPFNLFIKLYLFIVPGLNLDMARYNVLLYLLVALSILMTISANPRILAAVISCVPSVTCVGTSSDDTMNGSDQHDNMQGRDGNDEMNGNAGDDSMYGQSGSDTMRGGIGDDRIQGGEANDILYGSEGNDILIGFNMTTVYNDGADIIKGGPGDDKLFQSQGLSLAGVGEPLKSDGFKDTLNCGDGNDEAWINVSTDHDEAPYCEVVHKG